MTGRGGADKIVRVQSIDLPAGGQAGILEVVKRRLERDRRIREIHFENIGVGMGLGVRIAKVAKDLGIRVKVVKVDNKSRTKMGIPLNKKERIGTMELPINDGDVRFSTDIPQYCIDEIVDYPTSEFYDIPDCAQMLDSAFTGKKLEEGKPEYSGLNLIGVDPLRSKGGFSGLSRIH